jgi:hypothetical protein
MRSRYRVPRQDQNDPDREDQGKRCKGDDIFRLHGWRVAPR